MATLLLPVGRAGEAQRQSRRNAGGDQFLAAAPSKPEVLGKDAWPGAVQKSKRLTVKEKECVRDANKYLLMAVEEVLRMLSTRRATCDFDAATKRDEDENEEDEQWHRSSTTDEANFVGDGKKMGGGC